MEARMLGTRAVNATSALQKFRAPIFLPAHRPPSPMFSALAAIFTLDTRPPAPDIFPP